VLFYSTNHCLTFSSAVNWDSHRSVDFITAWFDLFTARCRCSAQRSYAVENRPSFRLSVTLVHKNTFYVTLKRVVKLHLPENQLIYTVQRGHCSDNFDPWWLIEDIEHWVLIQESRAVARKPSDAAYLYPPLFHLAFRDDPIGANRSFLPPVVKTLGYFFYNYTIRYDRDFNVDSKAE